MVCEELAMNQVGWGREFGKDEVGEMVGAIPRTSAGESAHKARCLDFILKAGRRH